MTNEAKDFNRKYGLVVSDESFAPVNIRDYVSSEIVGKPTKNWKSTLKRFIKNPVAMTSLILFFAIFIYAYIAILMSPWKHDTSLSSVFDLVSWLPSSEFNNVVIRAVDPVAAQTWQNWGIQMVQKGAAEGEKIFFEFNPWDVIRYNANNLGLTPSGNKIISILGTDALGRDIWTRTWTGFARSMELALLVAFVTTLLGSLFGSWVGMKTESSADKAIMKMLSIYNSVPAFIWWSILLIITSPIGVFALPLVFLITSWQKSYIIARAQMKKYIESDFMKVSKTIGISKFKIIIKHGLPNYFNLIMISFVQSVSMMLIAEVSLTLIFPSQISTTVSIGRVIVESANAEAISNSIYVLLPISLVLVSSMSMHFVASGINKAFNPENKGGWK